MLPGNDVVRACPHCGQLWRGPTWLSGNTFGAQLWSDARLVAPMLPDEPGFARCPGCARFFWVDDAPWVGEISYAGEPPPAEWRRAPGVYQPRCAADWLLAAESELVRSAADEVYLRRRAWWAANDRERSGDDATQPLPSRPPEETASMARLAELLDETDVHQRLLKGEVLRELGRFDAARSVLARPAPAEVESVRRFILERVEAGDTRVRPLPDTAPPG